MCADNTIILWIKLKDHALFFKTTLKSLIMKYNA